MAHALAFAAGLASSRNSVSPPGSPRCQGWHGEHEHAIPVGRIREYAVHRLWQAQFTVIGADRPLRDQTLGLPLARATIVPVDGDPIAVDGYGNILRLQPGHRRGKDKAFGGLMELHGYDLRAGSVMVALLAKYFYVMPSALLGNFCASPCPDVALHLTFRTPYESIV